MIFLYIAEALIGGALLYAILFAVAFLVVKIQDWIWRGKKR